MPILVTDSESRKRPIKFQMISQGGINVCAVLVIKDRREYES